jgi:hypothetical protein
MMTTADLVQLYENQGLSREAAVRAACGDGGKVEPATALPSAAPRIQVQANPGVYRFTLPTTPRTKKTSNRLAFIPAKGGMCIHCGKPCGKSPKCPNCGKRVGFTKVLPSEAFTDFFKESMTYAPKIRAELTRAGASLPLEGWLELKATIYRDRDSGDLLGYLQALCDWLQAPRMNKKGKQARDGAAIIHDDVQIRSLDGSRLAKDSACPRIECELRVIGERARPGDLFAEAEEEEGDEKW